VIITAKNIHGYTRLTITHFYLNLLRKNTVKTKLALLIALVLSSTAHAGTSDILNPPTMPAKGWEITNGGNMGQSFNAVASDVSLGVYIADQESYTQQANQALQASCTTTCTISPWDPNNIVIPSLSLNLTVYEGEGVTGKIVYQSATPMTLTKPFNGIASVDLGAAGVLLTVGQQYTVIYTETSGVPHTYWQFFSTIDPASTFDPITKLFDMTYSHGAYYGGWAYIQGVQQNPDSNIGDSAFQVIDNIPTVLNAPAACQGTSAIVSSTNVSKLFMTLANGAKVAYSNVYGSKGTTQFTYNGGITVGTFPVGSVLTYVGTVDASTICSPSALTIDPAPVLVPTAPICVAPEVLDVITNTCVIPAATTSSRSCPTLTDGKKVEGEARITAVGTNSITVGNKVVFFDDCTVRETEKGTKAFVIGQFAEYKATKADNGILTAIKIKTQ
jgi:hypothetical protein